ncbi:putative 1,4-beta-D-xylan synthase [Helianthus anomalus]
MKLLALQQSYANRRTNSFKNQSPLDSATDGANAVKSSSGRLRVTSQ